MQWLQRTDKVHGLGFKAATKPELPRSESCCPYAKKILRDSPVFDEYLPRVPLVCLDHEKALKRFLKLGSKNVVVESVCKAKSPTVVSEQIHHSVPNQFFFEETDIRFKHTDVISRSTGLV